MVDGSETADVVGGDPDAAGAVSLVLWTALVRGLIDKGVLSVNEVRAMLQAAHHEFAQEAGAAAAMALIARLEMNAV